MTGDAEEGAVELGKGLEADFEGDFADPFLSVGEEGAGFFDPDSGEVFGESEAGSFLKEFAEVVGAGVDVVGDLIETKIFVLMFGDELPGFDDLDGFGGLLLNGDLVGGGGEVLGEDGEEADDGLILFLRDDAGMEVGFFQLFEIHFQAPADKFLSDPLKLFFAWFFEEDLPGLEVANQVFAGVDGHGGIAESGKADDRFGFGRVVGSEAFLHLETGGT